ncbi:hypothetical protein [Periweissella ghanensis]|uniref:Uncharacterized protein n=1 Tax=Periweissella ghanensis TaxID=467997 RepID=A0ABN8BSR1_9LACO|nr:hypothetical protein [Periweissella ghanensis]MCM0600343.1 hypothetical protein [Periweissella ghanensis]CAH0419259.1 hypothetical protein WGH24286_01706 [Periweissella ghanensis]
MNELYGIVFADGEFLVERTKGTASSFRLYEEKETAKRVLARKKKDYYESAGLHIVKVTTILEGIEND